MALPVTIRGRGFLPGAAAVTAAGRVTITLGAAGLSGRLILPAGGVDLELFPNSPGLAAIGGA
ncbi:MAG: hypothetical protein ABR562_00200, partial [Thermoplasmatota archaeon]